MADDTRDFFIKNIKPKIRKVIKSMKYKSCLAKISGIEKFIPISALKGDNIFKKNTNTPWYEGKTLIEELEQISLFKPLEKDNFSMPVQFVNRLSSNFRGYSGTISSGKIKINDEVKILPSGEKNKINLKTMSPLRFN